MSKIASATDNTSARHYLLKRLSQLRALVVLSALLMLMTTTAQANVALTPPSKETANESLAPLSYHCTSRGGCYDISLPDWVYAQQGNAEENEGRNCGPASVVMAIRAVTGQYSTLTPDTVRKKAAMPKGVNLEASYLINALDLYGISNQLLKTLADVEAALIDRHHLVIPLLRMSEIKGGDDFADWNYLGAKACPEPNHCVGTSPSWYPGAFTWTIWRSSHPYADAGRFNQWLDNHWVLLKGEIWQFGPYFVTFDPNVWGEAGNRWYWYDDNSPKGRGRRYYAVDFQRAFTTANSIAIEIQAEVRASALPMSSTLERAAENQATPVKPTQASRDNVQFIQHSNYPPGSTIRPGQAITKSWIVKNIGSTDIGYENGIIQVDGTPLDTFGPIMLAYGISHGETTEESVQVVTPQTDGTYTTHWQLVDENGIRYGDLLPFEFTIETSGMPPPSFMGAVVDDMSSLFTRSGTPKYWREATTGYGGHFYWTLNNNKVADNTGKWTIRANPPGTYDVFVYVPAEHATTANATYEIRHSGNTTRIPVSQSDHHNGWFRLGSFDFDGKGDEFVRLTDLTGEKEGTTEIAFDVVGYTYHSPAFWESWFKVIRQWFQDRLTDIQRRFEQWMKEQGEKFWQELVKELTRQLQQLCSGGAAVFLFSPVVYALWRRRRNE